MRSNTKVEYAESGSYWCQENQFMKYQGLKLFPMDTNPKYNYVLKSVKRVKVARLISRTNTQNWTHDI